MTHQQQYDGVARQRSALLTHVARHGGSDAQHTIENLKTYHTAPLILVDTDVLNQHMEATGLLGKTQLSEVLLTARLPFDRCVLSADNCLVYCRAKDGLVIDGSILMMCRDGDTKTLDSAAVIPFFFDEKPEFFSGSAVFSDGTFLSAAGAIDELAQQKMSPFSLVAQLTSVFVHTKHFAVEMVGAPQSRQERRGNLPKSYVQRDRLILLSVEEIVRRQYQKCDGVDLSSEIAARTPHCRRGHWRQLRSEKFSAEKREKPIWIKACWVGSDEWQEGQVRYKVRLDL